MVGDAPQLPSLLSNQSSNQRFDDATPAAPSLSLSQEFDDAPPAVPAEIELSSLPPLDRRSRSSVWPTAPAPDVVLTNHVGSNMLDDAQQCSLPPRCESNFSSRTCSQPLMHPTAAEAAVRPPRSMSLEMTAHTPTHVAHLEGPSTRYEHTAAAPLASLPDPPTDDVSHLYGPQPHMTPPVEQFPANRSHSSSKNDQLSAHDPPSPLGARSG